MSTLTPTELLNLWKQEQMPVEMSIGHILQNLVKQQTALEALLTTQGKLCAEMNRLIITTATKPESSSRSELL